MRGMPDAQLRLTWNKLLTQALNSFLILAAGQAFVFISLAVHAREDDHEKHSKVSDRNKAGFRI